MPVVQNHLFDKHPYKHPTIGSMEDLNSAKLEDFIHYNQRYYNPNNAVLVVAGDFQKDQAKSWIETYFGPIQTMWPSLYATTLWMLLSTKPKGNRL